MVGAPAVKMSQTPAAIERPAPLVGQHSREILSEFGWTDAEIETLEAQGIVATASA
jgi:crotonobetainyl-CoA:carnitine CoA-transferase CaiB-like acyl-CoA transferase